MLEMTSKRRTFLSTLAGSAGIVKATSTAAAEDPTRQTTSTYTLCQGSEQETRAYMIDAEFRGPTAFVIGGIHGDEEGGYLAAEKLLSTDIDTGRLVVIPHANSVGIERGTRHGAEGDLNRKFPLDNTPKTELAQAIWSFVEAIDPDAVVDLHTASGVYDGEPEGVAQAIHHSHDDTATEMAHEIASYINVAYNIHSQDPTEYAFDAVPLHFSGSPAGLLVEKTDRNLSVDAPSLLAEAYEGVPRDDQVAWLYRIAFSVLGQLNIVN